MESRKGSWYKVAFFLVVVVVMGFAEEIASFKSNIMGRVRASSSPSPCAPCAASSSEQSGGKQCPACPTCPASAPCVCDLETAEDPSLPEALAVTATAAMSNNVVQSDDRAPTDLGHSPRVWYGDVISMVTPQKIHHALLEVCSFFDPNEVTEVRRSFPGFRFNKLADRIYHMQVVDNIIAHKSTFPLVMSVGVGEYTYQYVMKLRQANVTLVTVDPDIRAALYGAHPYHHVDTLQAMAHRYPKGSFSIIFVHGIMGFGINSAKQQEDTWKVLQYLVAPGGWVYIMHCDRTTPVIDGQRFVYHERFAPANGFTRRSFYGMKERLCAKAKLRRQVLLVCMLTHQNTGVPAEQIAS